MIAIIDYDAGNIKSVQKAFEYVGEDVLLTRDASKILSADKVVLPGVGSFGDAMQKLNEYDLVGVINEVIDKGTPFLGICLGMQLLFERSEESPGVSGLGILKGEIVKIPDEEGYKIPHIGWNSLMLKGDASLFYGAESEPYVYFVHSYYLKADDRDVVAATCDYTTTMDVSVEKDNIFGCQFHPEKSSDLGIEIIKNFLKR